MMMTVLMRGDDLSDDSGSWCKSLIGQGFISKFISSSVNRAKKLKTILGIFWRIRGRLTRRSDKKFSVRDIIFAPVMIILMIIIIIIEEIYIKQWFTPDRLVRRLPKIGYFLAITSSSGLTEFVNSREFMDLRGKN